MIEILAIKGIAYPQDLTVFADENEIEFVGDEGDIIYISPLILLYVIQEYQKHFKIKAHVDIDSWKGIMGVPDDSL